MVNVIDAYKTLFNPRDQRSKVKVVEVINITHLPLISHILTTFLVPKSAKTYPMAVE